MKKLQILGAGCNRCKKLEEHTKAAADALGIDYVLEKITELNEITSFGVVMTPALAINGTIVLSGKVPDVNELKEIIK